MDAFADSDIGFAVCTWDIGFDPRNIANADWDRTAVAATAAADWLGGIFIWPFRYRRLGFTFEGFYYDKCTECYTCTFYINLLLVHLPEEQFVHPRIPGRSSNVQHFLYMSTNVQL